MIASPWAIIKCKFSDDVSDLPPDQLYERLFTEDGVGSMGMVDFFRDMSHGQIDVSGSRVFGWFTLPIVAEEYRRHVVENMVWARRWLMEACRTAASNAGVNLGQFRNVVATMNRGRHASGGDGVDLWGSLGGREAFCDRYSLSPSLLGQEMGHGYGLDHSRRDGSVEEYGDPWDTMSTQLAWMAVHPEYGYVGPGLNAVNMMIAGWFDESRLWRCDDQGFSGLIRLRPLHRPDLPGFLAAVLPNPERPGWRMILEFRIRRRWDAGIPESVILCHREVRGRSYLTGPKKMTQGDVFEYGGRGRSTHLRIKVRRIDENLETCDLDIGYSHPNLADNLKSIVGPLSREVIGGVPYDGGGAVILPGGQIVPIGPWDPTVPILPNIAALQAAELVDDPAARMELERAALAGIIEASQARLNSLTPFRSPAPAPEPPAQAPRRGCLAFPFPTARWR